VKANLSATFAYEGVAYSVNPANNTQPLYRFYNRTAGSHFYTACDSEAASIQANLSHIFTYEGRTYAVNQASVPNSIPVWRFFNRQNGSHFFTTSSAEKDALTASMSLSRIYKFEGIAFWLGQ